MQPDWVEVCRHLGADGHALRKKAEAQKSDNAYTASLVLLCLRDALAFSLPEKDRERAFEPPAILQNKT